MKLQVQDKESSISWKDSNLDIKSEPTEEDIKSNLIVDLISDKYNYKNEDKACICLKCEIKGICNYVNKSQRLEREQGGLGLCHKLNEFTFYEFVENHLEKYELIVNSRRERRNYEEKMNLILNLKSDKDNYINFDKACICSKCEIKGMCIYVNKPQRLEREQGGYGFCYKLDSLTFYEFVNRHLEKYKLIVDTRREKRNYIEIELLQILQKFDDKIVATSYKIYYNEEYLNIRYTDKSVKLYITATNLEGIKKLVHKEILKPKILEVFKTVAVDLDLVNASLKELGDTELKDDNFKEIVKLKEEICKKLFELDDNIKVGGKSDVQSK